MGAMVALEELLQLARGNGGEDEYGPYAGPGIARHMASNKSWRMGANSAEEIRRVCTQCNLAGGERVVICK